MVNPESCRFTNYRSVRFNLDNFALPVVVTKKKNTIYTSYLEGLKGTKQLSLLEPQPTYGYDHAVQWSLYIFASNQEGLYYANKYEQKFTILDQLVFPKQIAVVNDRLFMLGVNRDRITYSVDLMGEWANGSFLESAVFIPADYGLCWDIRYYRGKLLAICENGLFTINRNFVLEHLSDDSDVLKANLVGTNNCRWESDWFSLGYATNTQTLREVFLKTNVDLVLTVLSNRTQRNVLIRASDNVQKIKINLNGDQFKLALTLSNTSGSDVAVSDLSAIVAYGKKG
ncbi:MAG: hypothetical protein J6B20_01785 [Clostridia bacterium]|nr:hypothetical protein [Clostridia bacterium]